MTVGDVLSGWCGGAAPVKYTVFVHLKQQLDKRSLSCLCGDVRKRTVNNSVLNCWLSSLGVATPFCEVDHQVCVLQSCPLIASWQAIPLARVGGALDCTGILIGHAHNNVNSTSIKQKLQHKNTGPLIVNNNTFNHHLFPLFRLLPTFQLPQCYVMIIPPPPYTPPRLLPQQKDEVCGFSSLNAVLESSSSYKGSEFYHY